MSHFQTNEAILIHDQTPTLKIPGKLKNHILDVISVENGNKMNTAFRGINTSHVCK